MPRPLNSALKRLERMLLKLQKYNLQVKCKKGEMFRHTQPCLLARSQHLWICTKFGECGSHKFTHIQWWSPEVTQTRLSKWPSVTIAMEIIWCRWPESKLDVIERYIIHCLLWLLGWADTPRQDCVQEQPGTACSPICPLSWRTTLMFV